MTALAMRFDALVKVADGARRFAEIFGFSDSAVLNWKKARTKPQPKQFDKIAELSGISVDWLKNGTGSADEQIAIFKDRTWNLAQRARYGRQKPEPIFRREKSGQQGAALDDGDPASRVSEEGPSKMPDTTLSWERVLDALGSAMPMPALARALGVVEDLHDVNDQVKNRASRRLSAIYHRRLDAQTRVEQGHN